MRKSILIILLCSFCSLFSIQLSAQLTTDEIIWIGLEDDFGPRITEPMLKGTISYVDHTMTTDFKGVVGGVVIELYNESGESCGTFFADIDYAGKMTISLENLSAGRCKAICTLSDGKQYESEFDYFE